MIESRKIKQYARSEQLMKEALLSEIEDFNEKWNVKMALLEKKFAQEKEYFEGEAIFILLTTQPAFTCSKLTIETQEQGVKYVQS